MRHIPHLLIILFIFSIIGCGKGNQINGTSSRTAYRSVKSIRSRLPADQRIEYEVSFWTLRDSIRDTDEFLDTVGGKTPAEIIELGKEAYQKRKNAGYPGYEEYTSWDQMIAKFSKERIDQNKHSKRDRRDAANNVLYKL